VDSWWDLATKTVLTCADVEIEKILHQYNDYHFSEMRIEVDLLHGSSVAKDDDGMLLTGSYSTFCTMAMTKQKKQNNPGKKVQIVTPTKEKTMDQPSVITMNTLSKQFFANW